LNSLYFDVLIFQDLYFTLILNMRIVYIFFWLSLLFLSCTPGIQNDEQKRSSTSDIFSQLERYYNPALAPFYFGLASGDPLSDAVIIWTRVESDQKVPVVWEMATDSLFENVVTQGEVTALPEKGYTVKVDVKGLQPATTYFYRFKALGEYSPVGRTRTTPGSGDSPESLALAVVSCSNYEAGYFNAYKAISGLQDLSAVLHLGDYIYEYATGVYGDTSLGRKHLPSHEIVSLEDYRTRYAQYRLDEDLQEAHRLHPFITIWDDHEITNNAHIDGAQNHQPGEGDYQSRKAAARQAYYEWLPIREEDRNKLYRSFSLGQLADLIMLDERLAGRTAQADSLDQPGFGDASRTMLGEEQRRWFMDQLASSSAKWKIIGNQVIFSDLNFEGIIPGWRINLDAWDGYPNEKKSILSFLEKEEIENVVFVTGDSHCSWAFEVPSTVEAYREKNSEAARAVEFGVTSISSSNYDERVGMDTVRALTQLYLSPERNPHLKYVDLAQHGFLLLRLNEEQASGEWHYVSTIRERNPASFVGKRLSVDAGTDQLK
jgi:alkaline phosphatase D